MSTVDRDSAVVSQTTYHLFSLATPLPRQSVGNGHQSRASARMLSYGGAKLCTQPLFYTLYCRLHYFYSAVQVVHALNCISHVTCFTWLK